ncbi:IS66 family insertion sequence element accessory protein TnpA [Leptospira kirschneri]|uniref:IS66 family insertion sequence element accessory protein TnpA n=1 Tax=Leptospira kirschneri TaxID=29507 RepID=UPI00046C6F09
MRKTGINWAYEFQELARSGLSQQPAYSKKRGIKYTTFRYHWERRVKSSKSEFVEIAGIPEKSNPPSTTEFLTLRVDNSGKVHIQLNLGFNMNQWS